MPDWTKSMQQSFEYYIVDPGTWKDLRKLDIVKSSSISRDSDAETLGSASFAVTDTLSECYTRTYLVTVQNGITERHVLGTHLIQTPSSKFNGRVKDITLDGYTPLLELKDNQPAIGYFIEKGKDVMEEAYHLVRENARAPVTKGGSKAKTTSEFIADSNDTWLTYLSDFIANQTYHDEELNHTITSRYKFDVNEMGEILFAPVQDIESMQHRWTYTDDNSSILYPEISVDHDLYGIPNVVEVIYSNGRVNCTARKVIDEYNPASPISVKNRGREIVHRVINPSFPGEPLPDQIDEYATQLLKALATLQCTITYTHGYCPVRLGDCVMVNYERAGITNVKAKVVSQTIKCEPGCPVTEKAVFTIKLWEG